MGSDVRVERRSIGPADAEAARALFAAWPHRRDLHRALRLDPAAVADHLGDRVAGQPAWLATRGGAIEGLATARPLDWVAAVLGHPVTALGHFVGAHHAALLAAATPTKGLTVARAAAADLPAIDALCDAGFRYVGGDLTGVIRLTEPPPTPDVPVTTGPLEPHELDAAAALAARAHVHSAWAYDPRIGPDAGRIFAAQLRRRPSEPDSHVIAARADGALCGFIVARVVRHPAAPRPLGNLDFIGVDPDRRRRGVGDALNIAALRALHARGVTAVTVRTMTTNPPAIGVLRRLDWRVAHADLILHRWHRRAEP